MKPNLFSLTLPFAFLVTASSMGYATDYTVTPSAGSSSKFWTEPTTWVGNPEAYPNGPSDHVTFNAGTSSIHLRVDQAVQEVGSITHTGAGTASSRITAKTGVDAVLTIGTLTQESPATLHLANLSTGTDTGTLAISVGTLNVSSSATLELGRSTLGSLGGFDVSGTSNVAGVLHYNGVQNEVVGQDRISLGALNLTGYISFGAIQSAANAHRTLSLTSLTGDGYIVLNTLVAPIEASGTVEIHNAEGTTSTYDGRFRMSNKSSVPEGTLALHKYGAGTQILTNNSSDYNGGTVIHEGVLAVANASAGTIYALGHGAVTVKQSGTLAGSGFVRVKEVITVEDGGSIFASAHLEDEITRLTISAADRAIGDTILQMEAGSSFGFRFLADGVSDEIAFANYKSGGLIFDSDGVSIDAVGLVEGNYTLFTFSGIDTSELESLAGLLRAGNGFDGFHATFQTGSNSIIMHVDAIPEPGSVALGVIGLIGAVAWKRMNR